MKKYIIIISLLIFASCKKANYEPTPVEPPFSDRLRIYVTSSQFQFQISYNVLGRNGILIQHIVSPSIYPTWSDYYAFDGETVKFNYHANIEATDCVITMEWSDKKYVLVKKGELKFKGSVLVKLEK